MAVCTIKIGGVEIPNWESFQTDNTLDLNVNNATIVFPDYKTMLLALQNVPNVGIEQDVQILRDGVIKWRGYSIEATKYIAEGSTNRQYALQCSNNKVYLSREAFRYPASGTGGGKSPSYFNVIYGGAVASTSSITSQKSTLATSIIQDILNCQKSPVLSLSNNVGPNNGQTETPHVCLYLIRTYALQALAQLIDGSLWECRFNADNTVDFQTQVGSLSSVKTFNEGENILQLSSAKSVQQKINDVIVSGAGSASAITSLTGGGNAISDNGISFEVDNSPSGGPRYTKFVNLSNITDLNLLNAYANALAKDLQYSLETISADVIDALNGVNWHLGDVVTINSSTLGISGTYRVLEEKWNYDSSQGEQITLKLLPNIRMATIAHTKVRALEFILNSQTQNQQLFANSVTTSPQQNPTSIETSIPTLGLGYYGSLNGSSTSDIGLTYQIDIPATDPTYGKYCLKSVTIGYEVVLNSGSPSSMPTYGIYSALKNGLKLASGTFPAFSQQLTIDYWSLVGNVGPAGETITFAISQPVSGGGTVDVTSFMWVLYEYAPVEYLSIAISGLYEGATVAVEHQESITGQTPELRIVDETNGNVWLDQLNAASGTQYTANVPSTNDIQDHNIVFETVANISAVNAAVTNTAYFPPPPAGYSGGPQVQETFYFNCSITLNAPTIPT
ncbi:MAG: phage tail protein [Nitrososphaerales archaeon]